MAPKRDRTSPRQRMVQALEAGGEVHRVDHDETIVLSPDLVELVQLTKSQRGKSGIAAANAPDWWRRRAGQGWFRWFSVPGLPFDVLLRLAVTTDGRLVVTGLMVEASSGEELTARQLREISFSELLGRLSKVRGWVPDSPKIARSRPGPKGHPREHYEAVARQWREARRTVPVGTTAWLAEKLSYSEPTVRRWVQRARDMGLLDGGKGTQR